QALMARQRFQHGSYSEWELRNIVSQYERVREEYENMTPDVLKAKYLENRDVIDYDSTFTDERDVIPTLLGEGGNIVIVHPLEMGLKEAMLHILRFSSIITGVETLNLHDSVRRNPNDLDVFNRFIYLLNNHSIKEIMEFFEQQGVSEVSESVVQKAKESLGNRVLIPVCGSDSTGRDPSIPGMGFIQVTKIPEKNLSSFLEHHYKIPRPIADLIIHKGKKPPDESCRSDNDILCMGKIGKSYRNEVGDEAKVLFIGLADFWNYLNPMMKGVIRSALGFLPAFYFIGIKYAFVWLGITFFRNVLVDLIAASGLNLRAWSHKSINFDNVSQSLFWTGFSVPILNTVKETFILVWPLEKIGIFFELVKFFFICFANGLYISSHNWFRNFDQKVRRGNFFRSVLSWPFATAFSPLGNLLGIESIVQAKFWSDVVGGLIEGSSKYRHRFVLRKRDLNELLPKLDSHDREEESSFWERLKKPKLPPEELEKQNEIYKGYFDRLINLYGDPGYLSSISEFVVKNYHDKEVVALSELVGNESHPFLRWLRGLKPLFPGNS
ncbi:hypothetical protein HYY75_01590, partial [bacterium]|nr:hypothetical protein [bacterium]